MKVALTNAPVLAFPDYDLPFSVCTDTSAFCLDVVLMQSDERGKNRVIAYASRVLNVAETNYSMSHLETLAVVWTLRYFRENILGYKITIYTDHAAVCEI